MMNHFHSVSKINEFVKPTANCLYGHREAQNGSCCCTESIHLTQTAVTQRIRTLEGQLKVTLSIA